MNPNPNNPFKPQSLIQKVLIFTASLDERVLGGLSPADARQAMTDGIFPLVSMGMAFLSAFIFLTSTVKPPTMAVVALAGAWSLVVAFLEIKISEGIRQQDTFGKKLGAAVPRLFLALVVAFLIGEPLTQKIFQDDVTPVAAAMQQKQVANSRADTTGEYDAEIDDLVADRQTVISTQSGGVRGAGVPDNPLLKQLAGEADAAQAKADAARLEAAKQWEGTGSRRSGQGPLYREALRKANEAQAAADAARNEYEQEEKRILADQARSDKLAADAVKGDLPALNAAIAEQRQARAKALEELDAEADRPPGHLLMVKATWKLAQDEFVVGFLLFTVIALFMAVEIGLVLHRILQGETSYEVLASKMAKIDRKGFESMESVELDRIRKVRKLDEKQTDIYVEIKEKSILKGVKKVVAIEEIFIDGQIEQYRRQVKEMMDGQGSPYGAGPANGNTGANNGTGKGAANGTGAATNGAANGTGGANNPTTNGHVATNGKGKGPAVRFLRFLGTQLASLSKPVEISVDPDKPNS